MLSHLSVGEMYDAYEDMDVEGCACVGVCVGCPCKSKGLLCGSTCQCTCVSPVRVGQEDKMKVVDIPYKGKGAIAVADMKEHSYVTCYTGEIIEKSEVEQRYNERKDSNYILTVCESFLHGQVLINTYVDALQSGNISRFFNHSCSPNLFLELLRTTSNPIPYIAFYTTRDISRGEELSFNYNAAGVSEECLSSSTPCHCGADNCMKFLPMHSFQR